MQIIPAILTNDFTDAQNKLYQIEQFCNVAQIDFMDGEFVPSVSFAIDEVKKINTNLDLEAHLMINNPLQEIKKCADAGFKKVFFHIESNDDPHDMIQEIKKHGMKVGVALSPETAVDILSPFMHEIDAILILTVRPGFQGGEFLPENLKKVSALRKIAPLLLVGVDGGVDENNIKLVALSGADFVVAGSAIFKGSVSDNFQNLQKNVL